MYNADRYGWDPNQVQLIKARASLDYHQSIGNAKHKTKQLFKTEFGIVAVIIAIILLLFVSMYAIGDDVHNTAQHPKTIEEATAWVRANLRDVNWDDKINCVDYSVIFYECWPDSKMIRCWDSKGFNHLLNMVGGQYIEPQVRSGDPLILWSKQFPTAYKEDETTTWSYFATRRRW
jgi:hypothetical protein